MAELETQKIIELNLLIRNRELSSTRIQIFDYLCRQTDWRNNRQIAQNTNLKMGTVATEIRKLVQLGILEQDRVSGVYYFRFSSDYASRHNPSYLGRLERGVTSFVNMIR